jgi:hypothetical protein
VRLTRLLLLFVIYVSIITVAPGLNANEDDAYNRVVGRWKKILAADMIYRKDGTFQQGFAKGEWTVKNGKLILYHQLGKEVLDITVTKTKLRILQSDGTDDIWTRAD